MSLTEACHRATALREWPPYQALDAKTTTDIRMGRSHARDWRPAAQMTPESLSTASKIKEALNESRRYLGSPLFDHVTQEGLREPNTITTLEGLRESNMITAFQETVFSYQQDLFNISRSIRKALEEAKEYKKEIKKQCEVSDKDLASIEKCAVLALDAATTLLTEFQKQVTARDKEILSNPLGKDLRCKKHVIQALDRILLNPDQPHKKYKATLENCFESKLFFRENSQEDCWRWRGQLSGIRQIGLMAIHMTHAMIKAAACLNSLEKHKSNASFFQVSEEEEKKRLIGALIKKMERMGWRVS